MAAINQYIPLSLFTPESGAEDILQNTFSFIDQTEILKNGLVCRLWRTLTLRAWDFSNDKNLVQFSKLQTMTTYTSEFKVILLEFRYFPEKPPQQTHSKIPQQTPEMSLQQIPKKPRGQILRKKNFQQIPTMISQQIPEKSPKQKTPEQIKTSFWQAQGRILTIFKKLTSEDRQNVKTQMPHLFELEKMSLIEAIQTKSFETFSIIFSHSPPSTTLPTFQDSELHQALEKASKIGHFRMLRVLIDYDADPRGGIKVAREATAAYFAWTHRHSTCVDSLITKENQFSIACQALDHGDATLFNFVNERLKAPFESCEIETLVEKGEKGLLHEVVKPLKALLPPDTDWAVAQKLKKALTDNNFDQFKTLLASHSIKETYHLRIVAQAALEKNKPEFAFLLLEQGYSSAIDIIEDFVCRRSLGLSWRLKAVKFLYQHRLWSALSWIGGTILLLLALAAACYYTYLDSSYAKRLKIV
jgi:hypothetical protein